MAKKIIETVSKYNTKINVMAGLNQLNYVDGDVWRFPVDLYADIGSVAKIDVSTKDRYTNTLKVLLDAFNIVHGLKNEQALNYTEYDVKSGKFARTQSKITEQPQAEPQAQPQIAVTTPYLKAVVQEQPIMAQCDSGVIDWLKQQKEQKVSFDKIREMLTANKWTKNQIDNHFLKAFPVKVASLVPVPPMI